MRCLAILVLLFLAFGMVGCPTPASYIKATELGLENSINLDNNVETLGLNYYRFISEDTKRLVVVGEMEETARTEVLAQVKDQLAAMKEQSLINKEFVALAHDQAHAEGLSIEEVLATIQTINKATPEILEFYDKLKGGN